MKTFNKVSVVVLAVAFTIGLVGSTATFAATTPSLGLTATYGILGNTYSNTVPGTTINGDVGFTTGPAVTPMGVHANYGSGAPYATAGIDQGTALIALNNQVCTFTFAPGAIDLATDTTHGPIGIYTPGVYCTGAASAASIGTAGITLSGAGTYIFRINGAFTTVANSHVTLAGASACNVFWTPTAATTLGANTTFVGTDIDAAGVTIGVNTTWTGRALAFGGTVTTDVDDTITVPNSCNPPVIVPPVTVPPVVIPPVVVPPVIVPPVPPVTVVIGVPSPVTPVTTPKLPKTGFPPEEKMIPWNIIIPAGIFIASLSLYLVRKKQII